MKSRNLYWLETPDGFENWFVAAYTKRRAQRFHEYAEGYNLNYATAKFVCHIPVDIEVKYEEILDDPERREYWPKIEMLHNLGFIIVHENNPRQVAKNGVVYVEGRSGMVVLNRTVFLRNFDYHGKFQQTNHFLSQVR